MTVFLIVLFLLIFLTVFLLFPARRTDHDPALDRHYAHRGLWNRAESVPENSLAAFARAAEEGFGIELDVQLSADGEVYVFHDYSLARMTGCEKLLSDCTSSVLATLRLDGTDEPIPRLSDVLSLIGGRVPLLVELKGETTDTALCPKTDALLSAYRGPYCVESFNPLLLRWYRRHHPQVYRGLLYANLWKAKRFSLLGMCLTAMFMNVFCRPQFIAYDQSCRHAPPVRFCTGLARADRFTWTIRSPEQFGTAVSDGAFAIFEQFTPEHRA